MRNRHLAILGMSFTGSTIVSYSLGAMPKCSNVGESHWLVDNATEYCSKCGPKCEMWTPTRREQLRQSKTFYLDLVTALGAEVLISADKDTLIYDRLEPGQDRAYLMLYRDPIAQSNSFMKAAKAEGSSTDMTRFLNYWSNKNIELLARAVQHPGNKLLNLVDFQSDPAGTLQKICQAFGFPYNNEWETYWEHADHPIGGNFNPFSLLGRGLIEKLKITASPPASALQNEHRDSMRLLEFMDGHRMNLRRL